MLNARRTLNRARLFRDEAASAENGNRERLAAFLEASIIFGRSVTLHLQKELAQETGFSEWWEGQRESMQGDPVFGFFRHTRNFTLKEGPAGIRKHLSVLIQDSVRVSGSVKVRVIRGRPWYRRNPRTLWEDLTYPLREWWGKLRRDIRRHGERDNHSAPGPTAQTNQRFLFDRSPQSDSDAFDLLDQYLQKLDRIITEAETRWGEE